MQSELDTLSSEGGVMRKWLSTAKVLHIFIVITLMASAKGTEVPRGGDTYGGAISTFDAARTIYYSAAAPLKVCQVHVARDAQVMEGQPILTFEHQGSQRTIKAPCPLLIDNIYVSGGAMIETNGHLFEASPLASAEGAGEGEGENEAPRGAGAAPTFADYIIFK